MSNAFEPENTSQVQSFVRGSSKILPIGSRSKPALSNVECDLLLTTKLSGIVEYEPSEFTFTAKAGTPIQEVVQILHSKNQYLPFDPMLVDQGATLGGTIASGISGSGRFRYGALRDFLLGLRIVVGDGQLITVGGKVVKNAAGFDVPKFMVGSLGRYGIILEATLKVFPKPTVFSTILVQCSSHEQAMSRIAEAALMRWELDAIDYDAVNKQLHLRIGGNEDVNRAITNEIESKWRSDAMRSEHAEKLWKALGNLSLFDDAAVIVKTPCTPKSFLNMQKMLSSIEGLSAWLSAAANTMWIGLQDSRTLMQLDQALQSAALPGLVIRSESPRCWIGLRRRFQIESQLKNVFDPDAKFPEIV